MKRILGILFTTLGIALSGYGFFLLWQRSVPLPVQASSESHVNQDATTEPTLLDIPSLGISLPIRSSRIYGNRWETVTDGVSYLSTSAMPGEQGNSVMYGHNWPNLLGSLKKIKPGAEIKIYFGTRQVTYIVHYITRVSPSESGIYGSTSDYRLTLYTCIGFLDGQRLVVTSFLEQ